MAKGLENKAGAHAGPLHQGPWKDSYAPDHSVHGGGGGDDDVDEDENDYPYHYYNSNYALVKQRMRGTSNVQQRTRWLSTVTCF